MPRFGAGGEGDEERGEQLRGLAIEGRNPGEIAIVGGILEGLKKSILGAVLGGRSGRVVGGCDEGDGLNELAHGGGESGLAILPGEG